MNRTISLGITSLLFLSLTTLGPQQSTAQTYNWGAGNGVFNSQFNWNPVGIPGGTNPIEFNLGSDVEVDLTANHSVRSITKQGNRVTFVGGHRLSTQAASNSLADRLTFSGTGTEFQNSTTVNIGSNMPTLGELWIRGDAFAQTENIVVAPGGSNTGRLVVIDPGSELTNNGSLTVGDGGDGILFLNLSAVLTTATGVVASQPLSSSTVIVTNNSRWDTLGTLILGNQGNANVDITEGGKVTGGSTWIGLQNLSGSTVTVSGDDSLFQVGNLYLGAPNVGVGHLEILQLSSSDDAAVRVGGFNGGNFTNSFMSIADNVSAAVSVRNGSTISTTDLYVGTAPGTNGSLTISGAGSRVAAVGAFVMGGLGSPPNDGIGTLEVNDGGKLVAGNALLYNGTVDINDAGTQLEFESLSLGLGSSSMNFIMENLTQQGGAAVLYVGDFRGGFSGSNFVVADSSGTADFRVNAGSYFHSDFGHIGLTPGNAGEVTVEGTDSELNTLFNLNVGGQGADGDLIVLGGGKVSGAFLRIGNLPGSNGDVTVQGTGATIEMHSVIVGDGGTGTMTVLHGGFVEANQLTIDDGSGVSLQGGELRAMTTNNAGQLSLTGFTGSGTPLVTGNVVNEPSGRILISGTDAVIVGDVENNGVSIETNSGSCTFAGRLSGLSPLTGNGTVHFQGPVEPGNSVGTINIENDVIFDAPATPIFEIGGTDSTQYDRLLIEGDCQLAGALQIVFTNGHLVDVGNSYTIIEIDGSATGAFEAMPEGAIVASNNGNVLRISYVGGDGNDVVLMGDPGLVFIVPTTLNISQGTLASGTVANLEFSDNSDLSIRRNGASIQAVIEFTIEAVSPTANPSTLRVELEGSVFARTTVNQFIELFNYQSNSYELIGSSTATRFNDTTIGFSVNGDLSRFVEPGTNRMNARIRYRSVSPRQQFTSNTDQFVWEVGQ